ncbi:hypothetical protein LCGC14_2379970 [marine sediment metagenome]|uniref:Ryanodine receptor Ryr domain-containing protein n=1 Tax=marine sediment metagenome TaxID=412755 RepID=A0A0F9CND7_9ZZZZ
MKLKQLLESLDKEKAIELLAAIEHEQWIEWAKSIAKSEKLSPERVKRWEKLYVPYDELTEESKEQDRVYARKVLKVLNKV